MKVMTILGTRPEIIRLSIIIKKLDKLCQHILVHTGQNYVESLSDIFFNELDIRKPDYALGIKATSFGEQIGRIISKTEKIMIKEKPDKILILGDTNSGLSAITAKKLRIPVYHMEAGNRCYDDSVPEEVNRRIIDHSSDILMPYTHRSKENLIREGIQRERIFVIGNPIYEVLNTYYQQIENSSVFSNLRLDKRKYFLVTMHRAENVDIEQRLLNLVKALELLAKEYNLPIICSLHPRTRNKMQKFGISFEHEYIRYLTPLGLFDFVALEKNAFCVLSDSGTVQEECCIFNTSNVTIRDVTERQETIECGSNILSGIYPESIVRCVRIVLEKMDPWKVPSEYTVENVSTKVIKILLGYDWRVK